MSTIKERLTRNVNLRDFRDAGGPEYIQALDMYCPFDRQYVLRMVVCADGETVFLPQELEWAWPMFLAARLNQRTEYKVNHPLCYITIRHGAVESKTDDEWHVDGFSTRVPHVPEQNYIWCSESGTEYVNTNAELPEGFDPLKHNVNLFLQRLVKIEDVLKCANKTVYCLDPYILHRRPACNTGKIRTFVRISFVPIEIDDVNNTQNPLLPITCTKDGVKYRNMLTDFGSGAVSFPHGNGLASGLPSSVGGGVG